MQPVCPTDPRFSQAQALNAPRVPIAFREMQGNTAEPAVEVTFLPEGAPSGDAIRVRGRATFPCESELEARVVEFEDSLSYRGRGLRIYLLPAGLLRGSAKCDSPFLFEGTFPVAWAGPPKGLRVQVIAAGRFGHSGFDEEMLHDRSVLAARERGLLVNAIGDDVIRLAPALILTGAEADQGVALLASAISAAPAVA